jgi:hypothetical protein
LGCHKGMGSDVHCQGLTILRGGIRLVEWENHNIELQSVDSRQ